MQKKYRSREVEYKGKTYDSLSDLCKDYNVPSSRVYNRLSKGWTLEDAISKPPRNVSKSVNAKDHLGNEYDTKTSEIDEDLHILYLKIIGDVDDYYE